MTATVNFQTVINLLNLKNYCKSQIFRLYGPSAIFNNLVFYVHQDECLKRERCFEGVWIIT